MIYICNSRKQLQIYSRLRERGYGERERERESPTVIFSYIHIRKSWKVQHEAVYSHREFSRHTYYTLAKLALPGVDVDFHMHRYEMYTVLITLHTPKHQINIFMQRVFSTHLSYGIWLGWSGMRQLRSHKGINQSSVHTL